MRKIVNNKFDCKTIFISKLGELKDIMRCFYVFNYLFSKFSKIHKCGKPLSFKGSKRNKYKFNPKVLMTTKQLSSDGVRVYKENLSRKILTKPEIVELMNYLNYKGVLHGNQIRRLFSTIIKSKIVSQCKSAIEGNTIEDISQIGILCNYLKDNDMFFILEKFPVVKNE